jgi:glycosyltransferase involved in cell wall biosynthesis
MLSLVVPLYKTDLVFLEELLAPLEDHIRRHELEVIFVNDEPTNATMRCYLENLRRERPSVIVVENEQNSGSFVSYCNGFLAATQKFVGILDHDDILFPAVVISQLKHAERNGELLDLLYTNEAIFQRWESPRWYLKPRFDQLSSIFQFYAHHITVFRTDIAKACIQNKKTSVRTAFDIWLMSQYLSGFTGRRLVARQIDYVAYYWRDHVASTAGDQGQKPELAEERVRIAADFFNQSAENTVSVKTFKRRAIIRARFDVAKTLKQLKEAGIIFGKRPSWYAARFLRCLPLKYISGLPYREIQFVRRRHLHDVQKHRLRHEPEVPFISTAIRSDHPSASMRFRNPLFTNLSEIATVVY